MAQLSIFEQEQEQEPEAIEEGTLPTGWVWTTIGEIARVNHRDPSLRNFPDDMNVTFVPMAAVDADNGTIAEPDERPIATVRKGFTPFSDGDVIFAKITPCMENGKAAIATNLVNGIGFGSTEFHTMRPEHGVIPAWLFYFVRQSQFRADAKVHFAGAVGQQRVPVSFLERAPIPLAPTAEQERIVAEIEQQFTRLDAGVAALKRAQANLKRYKAAVLKVACEGALVPQEPSDEPAVALLARILAARRARWEADLRAKGKNPAAARYDDPAVPNTDDLPALLQGWCWATVDSVCSRIADCLHSTAIFKESGYLCVDTNCIKAGRIVFEKVRYVDEATFTERNRRLTPQEGDVLFSREGALLGVAVKVPANARLCLGQRMMIFRTTECIRPSYFEKYLNSNGFRLQYVAAITGSASPHLNIQDIRKYVVPLPPPSEQERIVAEVERRLSVAQEQETVIAHSLTRAERLRQAILAQAFAGRLVPHDPADEPASVLLDRIRAERATGGKPAGRNRQQTMQRAPQRRG